MTTTERPERTTGFPSVPKVLVAGIAERFPMTYVSTRFPGPSDPLGDVQTLVSNGYAVVRVLRLGGERDKITDFARISVDVIAADEGAAEDLAENIATWLADTRPIRVPGQRLLDGAEVEVAPAPAFYSDPTVSQFSAAYVVSSRRIEAR